MEDYGSKELSYGQLLLLHLNRMSNLSSLIQGDVEDGSGFITHYKESDKEVAFGWTTAFLESFIPDDLKDDKFKKELEILQEKYDSDKTIFGYNKGLLTACINLLHRKGLLGAQNKQLGSFGKKLKDESEEWENG
jgi:hypothetical protein